MAGTRFSPHGAGSFVSAQVAMVRAGVSRFHAARGARASTNPGKARLLPLAVLPQTTRPTTADVKRVERFDWFGAMLLGPSIGFGMLALTEGNAWGWGSARTLGCLAPMVALQVTFVYAERRSAFPLVDFGLFRRPAFTTGILSGLLSYAVLFGCLFVLPFYIERVLGHTPASTGLLLTPIPAALGIAAPLAGMLADYSGAGLPTALGMAAAAVSLAVLGLHPQLTSLELLLVLALLGAGLGLFTPANNSAIMGSARSHRLGVVGGILNMTRSLGTSLGVATTGAMLSAWIARRAGAHVERTTDVPGEVFVSAFQMTILVLAAIALVSAGLSLRRESPSHMGADDPLRAAESSGL